MRQIDAIEHDLPGGGLFKSGQHTQQRGFPAARCAKQRKYFAFIDGEADIIHGVLTIK
ncbi:Uncharacterised protein [Citrobacter koseri]|nr:Uncharacterised protein [Citrobacter koseri]